MLRPSCRAKARGCYQSAVHKFPLSARQAAPEANFKKREAAFATAPRAGVRRLAWA